MKQTHNRILVLLLAVYLVTTILSSATVIKTFVFGGGFGRPTESMGPRTARLAALYEEEKAYAPNTTVFRMTEGECDPTRVEGIYATIQERGLHVMWSARKQLEQHIWLDCVRPNLVACVSSVSVPSLASLESGLAAECRRVSDSRDAWRECFLQRLAIQLEGECDRATELEVYLDDCFESSGLPLPFPELPDVAVESLRQQIIKRIQARATYDRNYVANKIGDVDDFVGQLSLFAISVGNLEVDLLDLRLELEQYQIEVEDWLFKANLSVAELQEQIGQASEYLANETARILEAVKAYNLKLETFVISDLAVSIQGLDASILGPLQEALDKVSALRRHLIDLRSWTPPEVDTSSVEDFLNSLVELVGDAVEDSVEALFAYYWRSEFDLGELDGVTDLVDDVRNKAREIEAALEDLLENLPRLSVSLPEVPQIDNLLELIEPPLIEIPELPAPVVPQLPEGIANWFGADYNPPEVFDPSLNASLPDWSPELPDFSLPEFESYNGTAFEVPAYVPLPSVWTPSVSLAIDLLFLADFVILAIDTILTLARYKVNTPPGLTVTRDLGGVDTAKLDAKGWKKAARNAYYKFLSFLNLQAISAFFALVTYTIFLFLYVQVLLIPTNQPTSYVYTSQGPLSFSNNLFEFRMYNRYNAEFTAVTNECYKSRNAWINTIVALETEIESNITSLPLWADNALDLAAYAGVPGNWVPNPAEYYAQAPDRPIFESNGTDLCDCLQLTYQPFLSTQRADAAQEADSQFWLVLNAYVLKLHFFVLLLVLLRVSRSQIVRIGVLTLAGWRTPNVKMIINGPTGGLGAEIPDFDEDLKKLFTRRHSETRRRLGVVIITYLAVVGVYAWNYRTDLQLQFPAEFVGCEVDADCEPLDACEVVWCDRPNKDLQGRCKKEQLSCLDGDPCTEDTCDPESGCFFKPIPCPGNPEPLLGLDDLHPCFFSPEVCDDGNACTVDSCNFFGGCSSEPVVCDDGNACTTDTCDPGFGCRFEQVNVTSFCDDGNACTVDTCEAATGCVYLNVSCSDGNACTTDTCSPATGCSNVEDVTCDDGVSCTEDLCGATGCIHTPIHSRCITDPVNDDICTQWTCTPTGCQSTAIPGCVNLKTNPPTSDPAFCPDLADMCGPVYCS